MTFVHPWMLLGLAGALIPLLIHLFDRRRPRQVPFGAIAFVLRSQKRTASRLRLKRLLLYALRTLLLLAIPLALARPERTHEGSAALDPAANAPSATVIVVDQSLVLRWSEGSPLFTEALKQAKSALAELRPNEPATVLGCTRSPQSTAPLGFDRPSLLTRIEALRPTYEQADLNRCLELAARAMDESPLENRRIVLVSALTQSGLRLDAPPPETTTAAGVHRKPQLVLRDVAAREELPNRAIVDVRLERAAAQGPRAWQFIFTVRNFSSVEQRDVELSLLVGGVAVAKSFVDLAPNGSAQKTLSYSFPTGGTVMVEGALAPDALPDDDVRGVVLSIPPEQQALVVNGAPSPQKFRDEAFFVDAALNATGSPVHPVVRDADAAMREDFSKYQVLFLLNVPAPSAEEAQKLTAFVRAGGGLFISMGDRVDADAWNASLGDLLPRTLRVVKTAVEPSAPTAATSAARIQSAVTTHPMLAPFTGRAKEGLLSARFYRYMLFEPDSSSEVEVLGTLDDGAPVFLSARRGKGRVFAFASTVDRDWSDIGIRTSFLPLVQRAAGWLAGTLEERGELRARVGETITLEPDVTQRITSVRTPSGAELSVTKKPEATTVTVGPLPEPGRYGALDPSGQSLDALDFAATLDPAASDTSRYSAAELSSWFGAEAVKTAGSSGPAEKTPLWTWLLVLAALALVGEGVLLRK